MEFEQETIHRKRQTIQTDSLGRVVAGFPLGTVSSRLAIVCELRYLSY